MKIRNGFVSNSSSSSFIINGVKITNEEFEKISYSQLRDSGLNEHEDRYYFSSDEPSGHIIGISGGDFEDGVVTKIKKLSEKEKESIVEKLKGVGIEIAVDQIETYVQYISNDNY